MDWNALDGAALVVAVVLVLALGSAVLATKEH